MPVSEFLGRKRGGWRTDLLGLVRYHVCAPMPAISRTAIERVAAKEPRERSYRWCDARNESPRHGLPDSGCTARSGRMMFRAGWLLHSIPLAAAVGLALMAMQAPAVTHEYQTAVLQLLRSSEQEIAQYRASTRSTTRRLCRPLGRRFRNRHPLRGTEVRTRLPPPASQSELRSRDYGRQARRAWMAEIRGTRAR
jgi:hypothetical protein